MNFYKYFLAFYFIILGIDSLAQSTTPDYYISLIGASQAIDERITGFAQNRQNHFSLRNIENPPDKTSYFGIEVGRNVLNKNHFSFDAGLRIAKERNNYFRRFYHCELIEPGESCAYVLKVLDVYNYYLLGINHDFNYTINPQNKLNFTLGLAALPQFRILSTYQHEKVTLDKYLKFGFFSLEFNPHVGVRYKKYNIDLFYRVAQLKQVDRAIHSNRDDRFVTVEDDIESFNPRKLGLVLKFHF